MDTMKTRKIQLTAKKVDELMALFRAVPAEPVGDHLSDEEFIGYAMETLTTKEVQRVDEHLASCPDCAAEMEPLVAASEVWRGEPGKQRLAALRERLQPVTPPAPALRERFSDALRQAQESWQALFERKPAGTGQ
jgi:anti-sigma factor RsiW